jgi:flavin-dependent dehydrogenase
VFTPLVTYQLDRGRLENELGRLCTADGVEFRTGSKVSQVELAPEQPYHRLRVGPEGGERTVRARWVIDASGRGRVLARQLGLHKRVGHTANAAWLRVGHPIDLGTWTDGPAWHARIREGRRELSTNHLMGPGYWVWLIRLAGGSISIGIVAEAATHPFDEFNTLERALDWLRRHEPRCARAVEEHRDEIRDFRVMRDYAYSCEKVFDGSARWCLTGESGVFLDPLYSPGLDLIAISNGLVVDIVTRSLDGEDVGAVAATHDAVFRRIADMWLAVYENQYSLMGNARVMSSKVIWDTAFYWGVFGLLFFHDRFRGVAGSATLAGELQRLTEISNRVQAFFREWASIDTPALAARFVDLYSPLNFMVRLHAGMADELPGDKFDERFSANATLFAQLAGQLVTRVIDVYGDRYDDDRVMAQIQAWQRDPLLTDLIGVYLRERRRNPTSEGWMTMGEPGPRAATSAEGNGQPCANSVGQHTEEVSYV